MPAAVQFITPDGENFVSLGEVLIPETLDDFGIGEPVRVIGRNEGDTNLRNVSIGIDGDVAEHVQLARDEGGDFGTWADTGRAIIAHEHELQPGEEFAFWARTVYQPEDVERRYDGQFVMKAVSVSV